MTLPECPSYWVGQDRGVSVIYEITKVEPTCDLIVKHARINYNIYYQYNWLVGGSLTMYGVRKWEEIKNRKELVPITKDQMECIRSICYQ